MGSWVRAPGESLKQTRRSKTFSFVFCIPHKQEQEKAPTKTISPAVFSHTNFRKSFYNQKKPAKIPTKKVRTHRKKKSPTTISTKKKSLSLQSIYKYTLKAPTVPPHEKHTIAGKRTITTATNAGDIKWKEKHTI